MLPDAPLCTGRVFDFNNGKDDYALSNEFQHAYSSSNKRFVLMCIGNGRVGKSTRLNQLISRVLKAEEPFESFGGSAPVTMEFQFYGPMKWRELSQIHHLNVSVNPDEDVLLIDCDVCACSNHQFGRS
jgi:septin family protein